VVDPARLVAQPDPQGPRLRFDGPRPARAG
jgi:hypothetical protein